jgi:L-malate glycosyltransferase
MKLLFYNHTGQVSGAERVMLMILAGLDRSRFQTEVICPAEGDLQQLSQELSVPVRQVDLLHARFTWRPDQLIKYLNSFFRLVFLLRRQIAAANPDVIHANTIRAGLVATTATLGMKMPVIWHLHDILPRHPLSVIIRWYATLSARTHMIAVSRAVATSFCTGWLRRLNAETKTHIIHNGIDLRKFTSDAAERARVRAELGLREEQFAIGIVGQVTQRKGQLELIKAFAAAQARIPQAVLLVVGGPLFNQDHKYLRELERTAVELGVGAQVKFTGVRKDIPAVMQALDLLVLNSKVEPFSLVLLEAMACGAPILATAVNGVPELILHHVNGWLVPPCNEAALTEGLVTLGNNPELRARLSLTGQRDVAPSFATERYLAQIESLYKRVGEQAAQSFDPSLATASKSIG